MAGIGNSPIIKFIRRGLKEAQRRCEDAIKEHERRYKTAWSEIR